MYLLMLVQAKTGQSGVIVYQETGDMVGFVRFDAETPKLSDLIPGRYVILDTLYILQSEMNRLSRMPGFSRADRR